MEKTKSALKYSWVLADVVHVFGDTVTISLAGLHSGRDDDPARLLEGLAGHVAIRTNLKS